MARFGSLDTQYFDASGDPLVSGKIYFYESGTTTAKTTYADINNTIPNTNPVLLDASGRQPNIFFEGVAKATLTNSGDTQIVSRDPVGETATNFGDEWVSSRIYGTNSVVVASDGLYYRSLAAGNQNNNPVTTSGFWSLLYSVEWNAGITYDIGATVVYLTIQYQSIQASNLNHQPDTSGAWWVPLEFVWSATTTYELNQNVVGTDGILYTSLQATNLNHIPASSAAWWVGTSAAAAASATAALASQVAAAASEVAAETAETGAQTAETGAQTAETGAQTAETAAQTAQVAAELAETNAETAEAGAEAALDSFTDIYLGAFAVEPTVDNDGDPLAAGMLYYNTTTDVLRVYSGTAWQDAGSAVNGTSNRATYTATSGQTTFAIVYELGYVDVWLNGVKLIAGTDFTASNGTTIVLTVGATTGDLIDIIAFGTFDVANALTSADIGVTVQGYDATILVDADIGVTVQAYDANTALTDVANTFTQNQIISFSGAGYGLDCSASNISDQHGDLRTVAPVGTKTTAYTLAVGDVGQYVQVGTSGSIVIPDAVFAEGDVVNIFNNTTGDITITCTITTAYISGTDADAASVTLATRGLCSIFFISGTVCVIAGAVS